MDASTQSTLQYDLTKENKETISIDYRNSNYKHITISLPSLIDKDILLKQDYTYGKCGILWDNSYFLTNYLISHIFPNPSIKTMLELGAGTALPSIAALVKGLTVVSTDIPKVIQITKECIDMNKELYSKTAKSTVMQLSWQNKNDIDTAKKIYEKYDLIVGSELTYLDEYFDDLINVLLQLSDRETVILMTYKERLQSVVEVLYSKLGKYFKLEFIEVPIKAELHPKPNTMKLLQLHKL